MPIYGLTDRTPSFKEIGRLRLGIPKSEALKTGPKEIGYFRADFRPDAMDAAGDFSRIYGATPTQINVRLPFPEISRSWDAYYMVYNKSGLLGMADGVRWLYLRHNQTGALLVKDGIPDDFSGKPSDANGLPYMPFDRSVPVYSYKSSKGADVAVYAKPEGRLKVLVPELKRAAYITVLTHSIYNVMKISEQLAGIEQVGRNAGMSLALIPMVLSRRKELISVSIDGKKAMQEHYLLNIEIDPAWMEAQFKFLDTLLPGSGPALLTAPAVYSLPAGEAARPEEIEELDDLESGDEAPEEPPFFADELSEKATEAEPEPTPAAGLNNGTARPYPAEILLQKLLAKAEKYAARTTTDKQIQLTAHLLSLPFAGKGDIEKRRHVVQEFLFGNASLKHVGAGIILACLNDWLLPTQDSGGEYSIDATAALEIVHVWEAAIKAQGQAELGL